MKTNNYPDPIYIPESFGIKGGYYTMNEICDLLRDNIDNPTRIYYIADMLEE